MLFVNTHFLSPRRHPADRAQRCHFLFLFHCITANNSGSHCKHALGCYFLLQVNCFHIVGYSQLWGNRLEINFNKFNFYACSIE